MDKSVTDAVTPVASPEADKGGGAPQGATSEAAADESNKGAQAVPAQSTEWENKYKELNQKYERDIANIKSALDKQIDSKDMELKSLRQEFEKFKLAGMNDEERKTYEATKISQEYQSILKEKEAAEQRAIQTEQFFRWKDYFVNEMKIPSSELNLNEGLDKMYASGMEAIKKKMEKLSTPSPTQATPQDKTPTPPSVAKPGSAVPDGKVTLADLAKKYSGGDLDTLFRLAEQNPEIRKLLNKAVEDE